MTHADPVNGYAFHPEALVDLEEVWDYIAQDSIDAADRVIAAILNHINNAAAMPQQGHRRSDLTNRPLRFLHIYDYLIAYADEERPIWIVAIIHGRRSPRVVAAMLRDRQ